MSSDPELVKQIVAECVAKLTEHCDSALILVTFHDSETGSTKSYERGGGNFFAQKGQVHEWLTIQDQYSRNWAIENDKKD